MSITGQLFKRASALAVEKEIFPREVNAVMRCMYIVSPRPHVEEVIAMLHFADDPGALFPVASLYRKSEIEKAVWKLSNYDEDAKFVSTEETRAQVNLILKSAVERCVNFKMQSQNIERFFASTKALLKLRKWDLESFDKLVTRGIEFSTKLGEEKTSIKTCVVALDFFCCAQLALQSDRHQTIGLTRVFNSAAANLRARISECSPADLALALRSHTLLLKSGLSVQQRIGDVQQILKEIVSRDVKSFSVENCLTLAPLLRALSVSNRFIDARKLRVSFALMLGPQLQDMEDRKFLRCTAIVEGCGLMRQRATELFVYEAMRRPVPNSMKEVSTMSSLLHMCHHHRASVARKGVYLLTRTTLVDRTMFTDAGRILLFASSHVFFKPSHPGYQLLKDQFSVFLADRDAAVIVQRIPAFRDGLIAAFATEEFLLRFMVNNPMRTASILASLRILFKYTVPLYPPHRPAEGEERLPQQTVAIGHYNQILEVLLKSLYRNIRKRLQAIKNEDQRRVRTTMRNSVITAACKTLALIPRDANLSSRAKDSLNGIIDLCVTPNVVVDFYLKVPSLLDRDFELDDLLRPGRLQSYTPRQLIKLITICSRPLRRPVTDRQWANIMSCIRQRQLFEEGGFTQADAGLIVESSKLVVGSLPGKEALFSMIRWALQIPPEERHLFSIGHVRRLFFYFKHDFPADILPGLVAHAAVTIDFRKVYSPTEMSYLLDFVGRRNRDAHVILHKCAVRNAHKPEGTWVVSMSRVRKWRRDMEEMRQRRALARDVRLKGTLVPPSAGADGAPVEAESTA